MDERNLNKIMENQMVEPYDPNAKKQALNLAIAEFKNNQKSSQGLSIWARLTGKTTQDRRNPMEIKSRNKRVYGGMATAMAVVLIAGVTVSQFQNFSAERGYSDRQLTSLSKTDLGVADARHILAAPGEKQEAASYDDATEKDAMRDEEGLRRDNATVPMQQPMGRVEMAEKKADFSAGGPAASAESRVAGLEQNYVAASPPVTKMIAPAPDYPNPYYQDQGRDKFEEFKVNPVKMVAQEPVSTFSIDVDTASYSFARRMINNGQLPDKDSVRVEEIINYFDYNYPGPDTKTEPFKASVAVTPDPWAEGKQLVHIGIKGYDVGAQKPHSNLVMLLDVSGSMNSPDKLPLVKSSMKMLLDSLRPDDTVSIVVYAGAAGQVLEPTKVSDKAKIIAALDRLAPGGSTAGAQGIELAYHLAQQNFNEEGVNRVILATDGDFNVGVSDPEALKQLVEEKRKSGIFLSVLGFGEGNLNDQTMQTLAQNGNGVAAYIDTLNEARKVLSEEAQSTLFPIAKDVKIQIEFNPSKVAEYRLIGYETRHLNREDFNNDKIDAGDIGAGHTVTVIYEITPAGGPASVDALRYSEAKPAAKADSNLGDEIAFLKIRYKLPEEDASRLITTPVTASMSAQPSQDVGFSTAVAAFGQILKGGQYTGTFSYDDVIALAQANRGEDTFGYRAEFINMVRLAKTLAGTQTTLPQAQ